MVGGEVFEVKTTANFDIRSVRLDEDRMVLEISSSIENNIGEMQIPKNVTDGQLKFYLDGEEIPAKILQNDRISFVTLEFAGNGTHMLEITSEQAPAVDQPSTDVSMEKPDQTLTVLAVIGIVVAIGAGSTAAYYFKTKPKSK
jgi:hypothetical protein